jgi:outer membrane receptor for ferrienterochelin and colicins
LHPDDPFDRPGGRYWNLDGSPNAVTNPNGFAFDPSYNYAPMQGIRLVVGLRYTL